MSHSLLFFFLLSIIVFNGEGCLITNCPRGGKRSEGFRIIDDKTCISCGPGLSGKCLGSHICCGPFGCLMGTLETIRCRQEIYFPETEACDFPGLPCKKNNGKCVADGICCSHDACYVEKDCENDDKYKHAPNTISEQNLYNVMNKYQAQIDNAE